MAALDLSGFDNLFGLFGFSSREQAEDARRDFNASDCAGQKVRGLHVENSAPVGGFPASGRYRVNLGSYVRGERGRSAEVSASDSEIAGDISRIVASSVRGFDEAGNEIPRLSYDASTGEVIFSQEPASVTYDYETGYKDVVMDVTISGAEDEDSAPNNSDSGCGGGCDTGFGVFALLALAILPRNKK